MNISISILAAEPEKYPLFISSLAQFENEINIIHFDIMDGIFVKNKNFGSEILKKFRSNSNSRFDVHLMVADPSNYIEDLSNEGADIIIFHYEATNKPVQLIKQIRSYNKKIGLAINPKTNIEYILKYLDKIDLLLIMTVEPGACGQEFIKSRLDSIRLVREYIENNNLSCSIQVDGGINFETCKLSLEYGADSIVSGSYLIKDSLINKENLAKLKEFIVL